MTTDHQNGDDVFCTATCNRRPHRRDVGFAGMAGGDHTALVMITHEGVDRHEVEAVLRRRWPDVLMKNLKQEVPTWAMKPKTLPISDGAAGVSNRCGS